MKRVIDISSRNFDIVYCNNNNKNYENDKNYKLLSYLTLYFNDCNIFVMETTDDLITYYLSYNQNNRIYSLSMSNIYKNIRKNVVYINQDNYDLLECDKKLLDTCIIFLQFDDKIDIDMYNYLRRINYQGLIVINKDDVDKIDIDNNIDNIVISSGFAIINTSSYIDLINYDNYDNYDNMSNSISNTLEMIERINTYNCSNKNYNINLYCSYYNDNNKERQKEIDRCLDMNIKNPCINRVIIINESDDDIKESDKVKVIKQGDRYRFNDFFRFANEYTTYNDINILINSDIIIGKGFENLDLNMNHFICLSRHDIEHDGKIKVNVGGGSHDCWIWRGYIKRSNLNNLGNFYMGKFLCDGVLANDLYNIGYLLKNPVYGLMIYHYHISNIRNYSWNDIIKGQRRGIEFSENDNIYMESDIYDDGFNG